MLTKSAKRAGPEKRRYFSQKASVGVLGTVVELFVKVLEKSIIFSIPYKSILHFFRYVNLKYAYFFLFKDVKTEFVSGLSPEAFSTKASGLFHLKFDCGIK